MDYKYIEQLLERYWEGETTLQEESILRTFFSQPDSPEIPESLRKYQDIFRYELQKEEPLGEAFDARILEKIGEPAVAKTFSLKDRLMPLFKAAAIVAIILTLGNAAQAPWDIWEDPREAFVKAQQELADTVNVLTTIQAENVGDTIQGPAKEKSTYLE